MIIILILVWFLCAVFTEKSDYQRHKEAEKLPPFTKEEAAYYYYYTELKNK